MLNADEFDKPTTLAVGNVQARCPKCGNESFVRARHKKVERSDYLVCAGCGQEYLRSELTQQMTDSVVARTKQLLVDTQDVGKTVAINRAVNERGGFASVAKALGVSADQLHDWHMGKAAMPTAIFKKLLELSRSTKP